MSNLHKLIDNIQNPISGKTLIEEDRILELEIRNEVLHLKYNREGIGPNEKKKLEQDLLEALKVEFAEDKIFIISASSSSDDVYKSFGVENDQKPQAKPAELKVGHGTIGEKRSIPGVKHIIAVGSGKGGVGKSTFSSNLAVSLSRLGAKVGIVDADIYGPSMPMMFNKRNKRPEATEDQKIIPLENYGIKFISFGSFIHEDEPVVWRGPMLGGVLNQFFFETDWGELDYLILDLPPGTGDVQLSMVQNLEVDGAIIISTPQDIALLDARKALGMFDKMNLHVIGMVENMSSFVCDGCGKEHFIYGTGGVATACGDLGVGYLGKIPLDMGLRKGADFGRPYMSNEEMFGDSKVWNHYVVIASKVDSYFNPTDTKKKGVLAKLFGKSQEKN